MSPRTSMLPIVVFALWAPIATAQTNLGELLDGGAKPLSAEEFRQQVVEHVVVGTIASGAAIELTYSEAGFVRGRGSEPFDYRGLHINGDWRIDDKTRVCTMLKMEGGGHSGTIILPVRCEFWFKLGDKYFLTDSDYDRDAKAVVRTLKR